jgi:hypothetical protein
MGIVQYIGSRITAHGLSWAMKAGRWALSPKTSQKTTRARLSDGDDNREKDEQDSALENGINSTDQHVTGLTPAEAYARGVMCWLRNQH